MVDEIALKGRRDVKCGYRGVAIWFLVGGKNCLSSVVWKNRKKLVVNIRGGGCEGAVTRLNQRVGLG